MHAAKLDGFRCAQPILLLLLRREVGADALEHFGRHADGFRERRVRVNGLADVDGIAPHLDCEAHFADQIARMRADDSAAEEAMIALVEQ
jgi:hypothetical protein